MGHADKLRRKADLFRRAAAHPTEGGSKTDRILIGLAERLEREAETAQADAGTLDAREDGLNVASRLKSH